MVPHPSPVRRRLGDIAKCQCVIAQSHLKGVTALEAWVDFQESLELCAMVLDA